MGVGTVAAAQVVLIAATLARSGYVAIVTTAHSVVIAVSATIAIFVVTVIDVITVTTASSAIVATIKQPSNTEICYENIPVHRLLDSRVPVCQQ